MITLEKTNQTEINWDTPDHPIKQHKICDTCTFYSGDGGAYLGCAVNPKSFPRACEHWSLSPSRGDSCKVAPLKKGGFRLEYRTETEHFWSLRLFESIDAAVEYAQTAIDNYRQMRDIPEDTYLLENSHLYNSVGDCIYRDWLIYTQIACEFHLVDPLTNELIILEDAPGLLQYQQVDRAKDYVDAVEYERHVSPGQLSLFD